VAHALGRIQVHQGLILRLPWLLLLVSVGACATPYHPSQVDAMMSQSVESASRLLGEDRAVEASQLVRAAQRVDADYPGLGELLERARQADSMDTDLFGPSLLGSNVARRRPIQRSPVATAALYLPDRLLDLIDLYTFEVHVGPGAYFDYHITRALQCAFGLRAIAGVGTYGNRTILGGRGHANAGVTLLPAGVQAQGGGLASLGGIRSGYQTLAGLHDPNAEYYQEYEDYWSHGVSFTLGIVGLTSEFHYIQLADFLAGFFLIDFLHDDFAGTTALEFSREDERLILDLSRVARSEESLLAYGSWKQDAKQDEKQDGGRDPAEELRSDAR